jgi:L-seryl-tRNA(Ser) seleniumtransferase
VLIDDAGSGCLVDTRQFGLAKEPTIQEAITAGADLVLCSGDKLLGGPQAGIVIGKSALIAQLEKHPLARAVRVDKLTLAALEATLRLYSTGRAIEIPFWSAIGRPAEVVKRLAQRLRRLAGVGEVVASGTEIGGGSLPGVTLPTWCLRLPGGQPEETLKALRQGPTPIIGRIEQSAVLLDPRTLADDEVGTVAAALRALKA